MAVCNIKKYLEIFWVGLLQYYLYLNMMFFLNVLFLKPATELLISIVSALYDNFTHVVNFLITCTESSLFCRYEDLVIISIEMKIQRKLKRLELGMKLFDMKQWWYLNFVLVLSYLPLPVFGDGLLLLTSLPVFLELKVCSYILTSVQS